MATSYGHLDVVPGDHPLAVGQLGRDGSRLARKLATEAEVILAIGTRLSGFTTYFSASYISPTAQIIQVDIEPREIGRHHRVVIGMVGDAKEVAKALGTAVEGIVGRDSLLHNTNRIRELSTMKEEWRSELMKLGKSDAVPIKPQSVFWELREVVDKNTIVVLDAGNAVSFGYHFLEFHKPRTFLSPLDLACLGCGYPTALGAKIAKPEKTVIAICGDGGFSMMLHELATAVQHNINVTTVVLNNNCWGAEKAYQKYFYEGRYFASDLVNPNFAEVAEKFGAIGIRIEKTGEFRAALSDAIHANRPSVVEVIVDPDELNPPARKDISARKN
jgi:sulfoacetaldehyde acetyltransferase